MRAAPKSPAAAQTPRCGMGNRHPHLKTTITKSVPFDFMDTMDGGTRLNYVHFVHQVEWH